ncbi:GDSL esterase/lipase At5g45960-like isoform X2 [Apium graveolens]|uniref:GDSL esterase/lipase At5g45960-like isoform X2 n=1 Tax=Apium graveolens TaxID=4045 RepID=UPI003D7910D2
MDELMTGVSFASAGSRFNPLTAKLDGTISMPKQMENFKEYKTKVEAVIGTERTEALIEKTVYVISAGTNNFVVNYYGASGIRRYSYSIPGYSQFLVQQIQQFIEFGRKERKATVAPTVIPDPDYRIPVVLLVLCVKCIGFFYQLNG